MKYICDITRHRYVSSGYPCDGWLLRLSVREEGAVRSLNALAAAGDPVIVSTARWLAEIYGDESDPPEDFFTEDDWSSVETDEENLSAMAEELERTGWSVTWNE